MKLPGFLVVGAARSGTTALHYYLRQHPRIFLPALKEPCFFCFASEKINYKRGKFAFAVTDFVKYQQLFKNAKPEQVIGEISTPYLFLHNQTINNIRKFHPDHLSLKIIILLRNPIDRAYSQYLWKVRDGREELSFEEALKHEKNRMNQNYSFDYFYANRGLYYEQVKDYVLNFKNVKIILFDDFKIFFEDTLAGLCDFIGVENEFKFTRKDFVNKSSLPRFAALGKIITTESRLKFKMMSYFSDNFKSGIKEYFIRMNSSKQFPEPMEPAARNLLLDFYRNDILKLQNMTGLDLTSWLK